MSGLQYLSDDWLGAADAALADADVDLTPSDRADLGSAGERPITVAITVNGGSTGDRDYRLVLETERLRILPGSEDEPGVTMTMDYATSAAIARGELSAQRAFLDGAIRLGGDTSLLLGEPVVRAMAAMGDCFAELRSITVY